MQKSTLRRDVVFCGEWVLCLKMDFDTCINLFWQKKIKKLDTDPPKSAAPHMSPNWRKWLRNVDETMVWPSARYIFLKSETRYQTSGQDVIIWDPAMVSIIKTQLTIRQNINKVKIQKFLLFFQLHLSFFGICCYTSLNMGPRPFSLLKEGNFSSKFNYIK